MGCFYDYDFYDILEVVQKMRTFLVDALNLCGQPLTPLEQFNNGTIKHFRKVSLVVYYTNNYIPKL